MARGGQFDGYWYGRNGHGFQNAHINGGRGDYNPYHSYHYGPPHGYTWPHDNSYGYQMPQEKVGLKLIHQNIKKINRVCTMIILKLIDYKL